MHTIQFDSDDKITNLKDIFEGVVYKDFRSSGILIQRTATTTAFLAEQDAMPEGHRLFWGEVEVIHSIYEWGNARKFGDQTTCVRPIEGKSTIVDKFRKNRVSWFSDEAH